VDLLRPSSGQSWPQTLCITSINVNIHIKGFAFRSFFSGSDFRCVQNIVVFLVPEIKIRKYFTFILGLAAASGGF
jgi:hypothetical protein